MAKKRLTYADVEDLPTNHPLYVEFMNEAEKQLNVDINSTLDEESQEYFDRYIAGDR